MREKANVSVVIPNYNSAKTIIRALESVINQSLTPNEIIVVDDKSTDKSCDIINEYIIEYKSLINIELVKLEQNTGPAKARNVGWEKAKFEYIAFLDSDDSWHPQKIELQYKFMIQNPDTALSGHLKKVIQNDDIPDTSIKKIDKFERLSSKKILLKNYFATSTVMLKRSIKLRFRESKKYSEDYLLWLEIVLSGNIALLLKTELCSYYKAEYGVSGLSANMFLMYKGGLQNYRILLQEEYIQPPLYFSLILVRTLKFIRMLLIRELRKLRETFVNILGKR